MAQDFADSSGKGHALTATGQTNVTRDQFKFLEASAYFDGTGDYIESPNSDSWDLGSEDFTVDFWVYPTRTSGDIDSIFSIDKSASHSAANYALEVYTDTSDNVQGALSDGSSQYITSGQSADVVDSQWHHIAVVRNGSDLFLYVDGIKDSGVSVGSSSMNFDGTMTLTIGARKSGGNPFQGYIDEFRIYKNVALWVHDFSPPVSSHDGIDKYTTLLLHMEETTPVDSSRSAHTVSVVNAVRSTSQVKFGDYSFYLDGSGDYLQIPRSSDFIFGTGDFAIDFWARFEAITSNIEMFFATGDVNDAGGIRFFYRDTTQLFEVALDSAAGAKSSYTFAKVLSDVTWYHIALCRSGTNLRCFVDGIQIGVTETDSTDIAFDLSYDLRIGSDSTAAQWYFYGYIDEFRVSKGIARWTEDFILPQEAYPKYIEPNTSRSQTKLLCHFDGANASTAFHDYSASDHTVTPVADAKISTAQSKFGGSSAYFDGTGDYLTITDHDDWNFGTGDFTVDAWVYTGLDSEQYVMSQYDDGSNYWRIWIYDFSSVRRPAFGALDSGGLSVQIVSSTEMPFNQWVHLAAVRNGNTFTLYVNGVSHGIDTDANTMPNLTSNLEIAAFQSGTLLTGYLEEVRITKGLALWVNDFTPPTSPYPYAKDQDNVLLLHFDGGNGDTYTEDKSTSEHDVFFNGDAAISTTQQKFGQSSCYFDGTGDHILFNDSTDWQFGSSPYTIDFQLKLDSTSGIQLVIGYGPGDLNTGANRIWMLYTSGTTPYFAVYVPTEVENSLGTVDTGWHHIAVTFDGTNIRYFVDGSLGNTVAQGGSIKTLSDSVLHLAYAGGTSTFGYMGGYIDELRITKGIARWTEAFTPPNAAYPDYM